MSVASFIASQGAGHDVPHAISRRAQGQPFTPPDTRPAT